MAYSYECERDSDKCIQSVFWLRPTHSRFTSNCGNSQRLTLAQLVRARRGQAASFDIYQTDTGPTNFMDVELIPLCGFGHTEEWKMVDDLRTVHHPRW